MTRLVFVLAAFLALTGTGQAGGIDDARAYSELNES